MSKKKLAKIFYADLWGLRSEKYDYLLKNDIKTTKWQELKPVEPYYFFVPKDFTLQKEYEKFWKITDRRIFLNNRGAPYLFPLYIYLHKQKGQIFSKNIAK